MSAGAAPPRHRYVFLDGLRGIAALAVVVYHVTQAKGVDFVLDAAPLAVDFFFCLSGFVIAHAYQDKLAGGMRSSEFLARRLVRLYPMYLLGAILGLAGLLLLRANGLTSLDESAIGRATLLNLLYLPYFNWGFQQIFAGNTQSALFPSNHPAWSLFFELVANAFYAATATMGRAVAWGWCLVSALALLAAALMYGRAPGWGTWNFWGGLPRVTFAFFCGVLIYRYRHLLVRLPDVSAATLLILVVLLLSVPRLPSPWQHVYWLAAAMVAVPLLVALGARREIRPDSAAHRWCEYLGRISYPIYCLHFPLLAALSALLPAEPPLAALLAGFVVLAAAVSHLLMIWVDEPIRARLGARLAARRAARRP